MITHEVQSNEDWNTPWTLVGDIGQQKGLSLLPLTRECQHHLLRGSQTSQGVRILGE